MLDDLAPLHLGHAMPRLDNRTYWRTNIRYVLTLLALWFLCSFGCGVLAKDWLDQFTLPGTGFPLGFWFAQQGSIYIFVVLIWVYALLMSRLDARLARDGVDVDEGDAQR